MPLIRPTVGRVVWFHQGTAGIFPGSEDTRAAIVAHVHGDPIPTSGFYCEWMPYQKGQAAKTEAAEKAAASD